MRRYVLLSLVGFLLPVLARQDTPTPKDVDSAPVVAPENIARSPEVKPDPLGSVPAIPKGAKPVKKESRELLRDDIDEQKDAFIDQQGVEIAYRDAKDKAAERKAKADAKLQKDAEDAARAEKIDPGRCTLNVEKWFWIPTEGNNKC